MPSLPERALLIKLYYRNNENAATAVKEFRRLKKQLRGPMSEQVLRDTMMKFERTGPLGVMLMLMKHHELFFSRMIE